MFRDENVQNQDPITDSTVFPYHHPWQTRSATPPKDVAANPPSRPYDTINVGVSSLIGLSNRPLRAEKHPVRRIPLLLLRYSYTLGSTPKSPPWSKEGMSLSMSTDCEQRGAIRVPPADAVGLIGPRLQPRENARPHTRAVTTTTPARPRRPELAAARLCVRSSEC